MFYVSSSTPLHLSKFLFFVDDFISYIIKKVELSENSIQCPDYIYLSINRVKYMLISLLPCINQMNYSSSFLKPILPFLYSILSLLFTQQHHLDTSFYHLFIIKFLLSGWLFFINILCDVIFFIRKKVFHWYCLISLLPFNVNLQRKKLRKDGFLPTLKGRGW